MTKEENEQRLKDLKDIIFNLPEKPGSYQYLDEKGIIIYVGKAKNLKRRVSSYFNHDQPNRKTAMLVSKIRDIKYIVVNTEEDALLLENNLIKRYKPRYNILLKDDKTYPFICLTKEEYPRIFKTRTVNLKEGIYFGPYSHEPTMYTLLNILNKIYKPRLCHLPLTEKNINAGKYKVCLDFHMNKCKGPCVGKQSKEEYNKNIDECREILKGNTTELLDHMHNEMVSLSNKMNFEKAQTIKLRYEKLINFQAKSEIVNPSNTNIDVFNIETDKKNAYINYLHIVHGSIVQAFTFEYKKKIDESKEELLRLGIVEMRERFKSKSKEILVPFQVDLPQEEFILIIPQRGDKKKLLNLSELNVKQYKFDQLKQTDKLNPEQKSIRLMTEIKDYLKLPRLPIQIELFDNSNISGTDAVSVCVVFKKLKPAKKEYRKYIIKTVLGSDDYASMQEVVRRRYSRILEEQKDLPDLIITDGGVGQMNCVREVIENELHLRIPIAGLAKNSRHRTSELLYGSPPQVIGMKTSSELFHVLTYMQDEVHRFAITFHREKRSKHQIQSELDSIKGIGKVTKSLLFNNLKSVKRIKNANENTLISLLGTKKGNLLYKALHKDINN